MVDVRTSLPAMRGPELDQQHEQVRSALVRIAKAHGERQARPSVETLLFQFVDLVVLHFCTEEVVMKETAYPGYGQHSHMHAAILDYVIRVVCDYHRGIISLTDEIVANLQQSFAIHLETQDTQLEDYLKQRATVA